VALERRFCGGDARAAPEEAEERLSGTRVVLLWEIADGERRRRPLDAPLVRLLEPRERARRAV
jgi:hypothetical protein